MHQLEKKYNLMSYYLQMRRHSDGQIVIYETYLLENFKRLLKKNIPVKILFHLEPTLQKLMIRTKIVNFSTNLSRWANAQDQDFHNGVQIKMNALLRDLLEIKSMNENF